MEKVTVARRLRALGMDRGKTSPTAALELERLAEEVAALEKLAAAAIDWYRANGPYGPTREDGLGIMADAVERLEHMRSQR